MDDSQIVALYWQRDEQAIVETDAKYGSYCMKISQNILSNRADSEENVNDAYLHAWEAMPPQRPAILSAFLGRITRNLALNRCKAANAQKRQGSAFALLLDELDDCAVAHPDPESATAATMPLLTTDDLGSENAGLVCSLVMIGFGVASVGTSFLAKAVNTSMAFILAGVIAIVGILRHTCASQTREGRTIIPGFRPVSRAGSFFCVKI